MYDPVWEAVARLKLCGFRVMALVCDGLAANRKLFRLHKPVTTPTYRVKNPYADDGWDLYFICDPPHLIKCVRNAWAWQTIVVGKRLWCIKTFEINYYSRKEIRWSHLVKYHDNRSRKAPGIALLTQLKYEHIFLTSKMRIDLAAQVKYY